MKNLCLLFLGLVLASTTVMAQEHTGHGRVHYPRQQQQQQQAEFFKLVVVDGAEAEAKFIAFSKFAPVVDLHASCSQPVLKVSVRSRAFQPDVCFDRGEGFEGGTRYRCYLNRYSSFISLHPLFDRIRIKACGGDGIHTVK